MVLPLLPEPLGAVNRWNPEKDCDFVQHHQQASIRKNWNTQFFRSLYQNLVTNKFVPLENIEQYIQRMLRLGKALELSKAQI